MKTYRIENSALLLLATAAVLLSLAVAMPPNPKIRNPKVPLRPEEHTENPLPPKPANPAARPGQLPGPAPKPRGVGAPEGHTESPLNPEDHTDADDDGAPGVNGRQPNQGHDDHTVGPLNRRPEDHTRGDDSSEEHTDRPLQPLAPKNRTTGIIGGRREQIGGGPPQGKRQRRGARGGHDDRRPDGHVTHADDSSEEHTENPLHVDRTKSPIRKEQPRGGKREGRKAVRRPISPRPRVGESPVVDHTEGPSDHLPEDHTDAHPGPHGVVPRGTKQPPSGAVNGNQHHQP